MDLLAQATVVNATVPTWQIVGIILSAVLGFASTVVSSLVLFTIKNLTERITAVEFTQKALIERKIDCQRDFVSSENWVRSETYTRAKMDAVLQELQRISQSAVFSEKMPEIASAIADAVTRAVLRSENERGATHES